MKGTVPKQHFVNKLRELGYTFKGRQRRTELYRLKGGTHCVDVPRCDYLPDMFIRCALRQCGQTSGQIDKFLSDARA